MRCYAARRRRVQPRKSTPEVSASYAFVLLKPEDKNDAESSFLSMLNPFKAVREGPALYAVAAMERSVCTKHEVLKKTDESNASQDKLSEGFFTTLPHVTRTELASVLGPHNDAKLVPGAVVAVNLNTETPDMRVAGVVSQYGFADKALTWNANFKQGYGKVVNVHRGADGQVHSADVAFEGLWFQEYAASVNLHYVTDNGFYASVHPTRIIAHANSRNILITTLIHDLSWEFALVWPSVLNLEEDIHFFDVASGERLVRAGKTIGDLVRGDLEVKVRGHSVPVLDPTEVLPKGFFS
eukprot:TRINITY_DN21803_c0_g1_i1.p1 TRINITY_DN21803_c0_g1~~TRINITY_DN21803_c0_g1_i1.p1  ORF type:complete len:332 (+),score=44.30 TRINITY_DN21803_c0_g1_i1:107-997(+)